MAFPQVQSVTQTTTTSATVHNVNMPATVNAGDLLVILVNNSVSNINSNPAGWTLLRSSTQTPVYIKKAAGTEGGGSAAIGTSSGSNIAAQVYRITGWFDSGTILNDVELATTTGSSANPNPPSLNPSNWGAEDTLWIVYAGWTLGESVSAYPADYTTGMATNATGARIATARRENNAATEDPGAYTLTGSVGWRAHTIAIRPSGAWLFEGSAELDFDGEAAMDVISDIIFTGSGSLDFDGEAQVTQEAIFEGEEEVSFDGAANLSGGAVLLTGEGEVSFDGTALLNQEAILEGFGDVEMNGLARLGVIQEFAAQAALMFDGSASLSIIGWQDVDVAANQIWTVKK